MEDTIAKEETTLQQELEELRAENKILRDSLVEYRREEPGEEEQDFEQALKDLAGRLQVALTQTRETLRPGTDKMTEILSKQMEEHPVPMLLVAFGAGFLLSHSLERKSS